MKNLSRLALAAVAAVGLAAPAVAGDPVATLKKGTPEPKSVGALAFGPEGILFVADPVGAGVFAIATGEAKADPKPVNVEKIDDKIAGLLGVPADQILIHDAKVNPQSGTVYLSVSRGKGPDAAPVLIKVGADGKPAEFALKDVPFAAVTLADADTKMNPRSKEVESITQIAFVNNQVIVAGLSNEAWKSTLRTMPFPFMESVKPTGVEIYHGAHGKYETAAPVRTFLGTKIAGQTHVVAAYTCTPLVKFPVSDIKPGEKVKGVTVAELGNMNRPLDMIAYTKDKKDYILIANSARGVMKVDVEGIDTITAIAAPVKGTAGLKYETVKDLKDVMQLDKLSDDKAVILVKSGKNFDLKTIDLP